MDKQSTQSVQQAIQDINQTSSTVVITPNKRFFTEQANRTQEYKNLPAKFRPALEQVGDYVRTVMIPRVFRDEGPGWAQLAKMTQRDRLSKGYGGQHPILIRTGDLYKELTEKSHPNHIEIIKTGKESRIVLGGSSVKFIQNQTGVGDPGQKLPARPMLPGTGGLPVSDNDITQITSILVTAVQKALQS